MNQLHQKDDSLVKYQLDMSTELEDLKFDLMGYRLDEKTNTYVTDDTKTPLMNPIGANAIYCFIRPRISKVISLSNQSEDIILKNCLRFVNDLCFILCRHMKEFDIKSYAVMDNVINLCDDIFQNTALKSVEGWERDGIRKQHQTSEVKETLIEKKPGGILQNPFLPK